MLPAMFAAYSILPSLFNLEGVMGQKDPVAAQRHEIRELIKDVETHRRDIERWELESRIWSEIATKVYLDDSTKYTQAALAEHRRRMCKAIDSQIADKLTRIKSLEAEVKNSEYQQTSNRQKVRDEIADLNDRHDREMTEAILAIKEVTMESAALKDAVTAIRAELDRVNGEKKVLQRTIKSLGTKLNNLKAKCRGQKL